MAFFHARIAAEPLAAQSPPLALPSCCARRPISPRHLYLMRSSQRMSQASQQAEVYRQRTAIPFDFTAITFRDVEYSVPLPPVSGWLPDACSGRLGVGERSALGRQAAAIITAASLSAFPLWAGPGERREFSRAKKVALLQVLTWRARHACVQDADPQRADVPASGPHQGALRLLRGIHGVFRPHVLTALMGASGAGGWPWGAGQEAAWASGKGVAGYGRRRRRGCPLGSPLAPCTHPLLAI